MLKKIFWSKYMTWLRKLLAVNKLNTQDIPWEDILNEDDNEASPCRGALTSFSGVDVKVYFEDEGSNFICIPEIRAVSCVCGSNGRVQGEIITLLFDGDALSYLPIKPKNMLMVAANEYGTLCYTRFKDIKFCAKRWSITIDDIAIEVSTKFSAESHIPWKKVEDSPGKVEKVPSELPEQILKRLSGFK